MALRVVTYLLIVLLLVPLAAIVATSFTTLSYVTFPPQGFTLRWYGEAFRKQEFLDSFKFKFAKPATAATASKTR